MDSYLQARAYASGPRLWNYLLVLQSSSYIVHVPLYLFTSQTKTLLLLDLSFDFFLVERARSLRRVVVTSVRVVLADLSSRSV